MEVNDETLKKYTFNLLYKMAFFLLFTPNKHQEHGNTACTTLKLTFFNSHIVQIFLILQYSF